MQRGLWCSGGMFVFKRQMEQVNQVAKRCTIISGELSDVRSGRHGMTFKAWRASTAVDARHAYAGLTTDFGTRIELDAADNLGADFADLVIAQRAVAGAQGDAEGDAAHALANLGASVDVEDLDIAEGVARVLANRLLDLFGADADRGDHGEVLRGGWVA